MNADVVCCARSGFSSHLSFRIQNLSLQATYNYWLKLVPFWFGPEQRFRPIVLRFKYRNSQRDDLFTAHLTPIVLSVNVTFAGHLGHFNSARFDNPC